MMREYIKITSISFTIVVILNCINMIFFQQESTIKINIIFWVLGVCMVFNFIAILLSKMDFKSSILRDIILILTLIIMVLLVNIYNGISLTVLSVIEIAIVLAVIYYFVVFIMYRKNWRDEVKINEKIKREDK